MKTRSIFFTLLLAATAFTFTQCGESKKEESHDEHEHAAAEESTAKPEAGAPQFTVDAKFQEQLSAVFTSYVSLKDAFVSSDAKKVSTEAAATTKALAGADMMLLTGAAHHDWMTYLGGMETSLKTMASATDIAAQRQAFSTLTENLYKSIKAYGLGGTTAYYDFCPMAFDNKGAFWLSNAAEIRNPYFGDEMLTCGSVQEKLK